MHSVPVELATGVDGSGRLALRVATLPPTAVDRTCSLGGSDPHQDNFASACAAVGIQGLVETACVSTKLPRAAASAKASFSAGCGKIPS